MAGLVVSRRTADQPKGHMAARTARISRVGLVAGFLIVVALVVRAVLAFRGYFYWDDLILTGRAGTQNILSASYLFDDHDGHVMPAAFLSMTVSALHQTLWSRNTMQLRTAAPEPHRRIKHPTAR